MTPPVPGGRERFHQPAFDVGLLLTSPRLFYARDSQSDSCPVIGLGKVSVRVLFWHFQLVTSLAR